MPNHEASKGASRGQQGVASARRRPEALVTACTLRGEARTSVAVIYSLLTRGIPGEHTFCAAYPQFQLATPLFFL